jgi:hypothetical protein
MARTKERAKDRPTRFARGTVDWYRASFNAAAMLTNLAEAEEVTGRGRKLTQAAEVLAEALKLVGEHPDEPYSLVVRQPAVVLAAGIAASPYAPGGEEAIANLLRRAACVSGVDLPADEEPVARADRLVGAIEREAIVNARTLYNIACYRTGRNDLDGAAGALRVALRLEPRLRDQAAKDPTLARLLRLHPELVATPGTEPDVVD